MGIEDEKCGGEMKWSSIEDEAAQLSRYLHSVYWHDASLHTLAIYNNDE